MKLIILYFIIVFCLKVAHFLKSILFLGINIFDSKIPIVNEKRRIRLELNSGIDLSGEINVPQSFGIGMKG